MGSLLFSAIESFAIFFSGEILIQKVVIFLHSVERSDPSEVV